MIVRIRAAGAAALSAVAIVAAAGGPAPHASAADVCSPPADPLACCPPRVVADPAAQPAPLPVAGVGQPPICGPQPRSGR